MNPVVELVRSATTTSRPFGVSFIVISMLSPGDINRGGPFIKPSVVMGAPVVGI
jgi:hypothetical protein